MRISQLTVMVSFLATSVLVFAGVPGCKKAPPPPPPAKGTGSGGGGGGGDRADDGAGASGIRGVVVETMDAAGYTYLKLRTAQGEVWAAVSKATVTKGQRVTVVRAQPMKNFKSRTLKRTFPLIYFGQLGRAGQAGRNPHAMRGPLKGHPKRTGKREAFDKPLAKAPGPNGRTVAEVHAQRETLAGKTVVVRGRVVKVARNIMGKNWLHLQDGTGKTDDFDLTVTSKDTAKVGDVVLVEGTVKANVNIGAGYSYKVLVEQATVKAGQ